ncbi:MAG: reverse transcriptase domain-containing protein [Candidatus Paceibacterota bacterium]
MGKIVFTHTYEDIISLENLLSAWEEFVRGKRGRRDVQEFELNLMENILELHSDLSDKEYSHSPYEAFNISDPKPRNIHKAKVRDRLLHHALHQKLYPFFDRTFIADSYSCRIGKGTHRAMDRFKVFSYKVSKNHTRTAHVLKCDIRKFFASIDHVILISILEEYIPDEDITWLLRQVISSFHVHRLGTGLPLGNLTSQLLVNVYMNVFDQYVKHKLKTKYYIRYADDFVFLSEDRGWLESLIPQISSFLETELSLKLHPRKVSIETLASGVDFLGWVHFPDHRVLRTTTKRRVLRALENNSNPDTLQSYHGLLSHGNAYDLQEEIKHALSLLGS